MQSVRMERGVEVGDDISSILDPDRHAHKPRADADLLALRNGQTRVARLGRETYGRVAPAQRPAETPAA